MKEATLELFFKGRLMEMGQIAKELAGQIGILEKMAEILEEARHYGHRLFFCGVGGGAGNGTHAAGDLFKSCRIKAACLTDNVPTVTAITNDEGWSRVFVDQLDILGFGPDDVLFVFSVGGGDAERNISANIVEAVKYAKEKGAHVLGVVGKADGYTARNGDAVIVVPTVNPDYRTTHTESLQGYIAHLLTEVLRQRSAKWESVT
ncbi:MAG: SIS domain-containing protein [Candidatus Moranbacteria bacterium]|nr:SIS domain-containing protein [Candidatus Moranbacteria bacterium]